MNLARHRDAAEQDIRADPARTSGRGGERLSLFDDLADEKMLRHDEEINDRKRLEIVVHEEQVGIIACSQTFAFRLECAVDNPRAKFAFLTLELELLIARGTEEICERTVVGEGRNLHVAAMRAVCPCAYPSLRPCSGALRSVGIGGL